MKRYKEMNTPLDNTLGPSSYTKYTTKKILSLDIEIAVCFFLFFSFSLRRVKTLRLECDELFDVRHDFAFYFSKGREKAEDVRGENVRRHVCGICQEFKTSSKRKKILEPPTRSRRSATAFLIIAEAKKKKILLTPGNSSYLCV